MPQLGESIAEATIVALPFQVGRYRRKRSGRDRSRDEQSHHGRGYPVPRDHRGTARGAAAEATRWEPRSAIWTSMMTKRHASGSISRLYPAPVGAGQRSSEPLRQRARQSSRRRRAAHRPRPSRTRPRRRRQLPFSAPESAHARARPARRRSRRSRRQRRRRAGHR